MRFSLIKSTCLANVLLVECSSAFQPVSLYQLPLTHSSLGSKRGSDDDTVLASTFPVGTFVEFEEKSRIHVGKISHLEHKSNGGARYTVTDSNGNIFNIADKEVHFAIYAPNAPKAAEQLFDQFCQAQQASDEAIQKQLEISPELLELAWEEALENAESGDGADTLTPSKLVELVHSHAASAIEKYKAWRFLQSDLSHVFFKDIKDHGRISSFKAKARKAVDAAKQSFCQTHENSDLCLV
ncbi:hypothetical protein IV203_003735 [Nitzschia inconspicua]|uniref:Ribonuclease II winged helix domain-containing protein n=1 Tax=Nitzschia inconspicua TaxID=303405 RepID=A0A9K3L2G3_9STRA|nr:hypothetical protein IV203_003735 [Nitzschia inconspicua]